MHFHCRTTKSKLIIVLLILNCLAVFSQPELLFPLKNEFSWKDVEKTNDALKNTFVNHLPKELEYYKQVEDSRTKILKSLHVIDFNNDGLDDLVFDGWGGGEPDKISIFLNNGKSFVHLFTDLQGIHKLVTDHRKVVKLYIQDWGCCCEVITTNKIYNVNYSSGIPKFELQSQMQFMNQGELPVSYFDRPIKFSILNNDYNIRLAPLIDDTTEVYYCGLPRKGNGLGKLSAGTIGYGLSQKTDSTGRVWWFVAITPETVIKESMFHDSKDEPRDYKLGWISSRYIKKLEE
jgi:hypothetical protein